jgi:hypothetical protein
MVFFGVEDWADLFIVPGFRSAVRENRSVVW